MSGRITPIISGKGWRFLGIWPCPLWAFLVRFTSTGSQKKQENSRKTSTSASLTMLKLLTVWVTKKLWKILKETGVPDHLTCLLRNLYVGQEATIRTRHGIMDWFKIGKGVHQGRILLPGLFNLYAGYII